MSFLNLDLANKLNQVLGSLVFDITLTSVDHGITNANPTEGASQEVFEYTVKGFVDMYEARRIDDHVIQQSDRLLTILGGSLPAGILPKLEDFTTIDGEKKRIINIQVDAAKATYLCQLR